MGMNAKAYIFYGYDDGFCDLIGRDEKTVRHLGVDVHKVGECHYLLIRGSGQRFDWNHGPERLDAGKFLVSNETIADWKEKLKQACDLINFEWDESRCGWLVTCDYS